MEEVKKVYEQYKHLDSMLSDAEWLGVKESPMKRCLYDMWMAIRHDCQNPSPPEMPEDTAPIYVTKFNNDGDSTRPPFLGGACAKFSKAVGKKPANSCIGCTIPGCKVKGQTEQIRDFERDEPETVEKDS